MRVYSVCISIIVCLSIFFVQSSNAQVNNNSHRKDSLLNEITDINKRVRGYTAKDTIGGHSVSNFVDSIINDHNVYMRTSLEPRDANGLLIVESNWVPFDDYISFRDTIIYNPAFLPVIFDGRILPQNINFIPKREQGDALDNYHLIAPDSTLSPNLMQVQRIQDSRRFYYMNNLTRVKTNALSFGKGPVIDEEVVEKRSILQQLLSTDNSITFNKPEVEKIKIKKVFWLINGDHSLQIAQRDFSDNWNGTGRDNSFEVKNFHKITANYKKGKLTLNNLFEWKLDFQHIPNDSIHKINVNDDYFKIYSVLGLEAFKKWSYTVNLEAKTALVNSYPVNSETKRTAFLSPLTVNTGVGMSYNTETKSTTNKYRNFKLSADISPISINYTYVEDGTIDPTRFGVEKDKKSKIDFGSTVNLKIDYSFSRVASLSSRWKYFSNYEKVIAESENKFSFDLNRFLSMSVDLYIRFDDAIGYENRDEKYGYFQYQQALGFGLKYKW